MNETNNTFSLTWPYLNTAGLGAILLIVVRVGYAIQKAFKTAKEAQEAVDRKAKDIKTEADQKLQNIQDQLQSEMQALLKVREDERKLLNEKIETYERTSKTFKSQYDQSILEIQNLRAENTQLKQRLIELEQINTELEAQLEEKSLDKHPHIRKPRKKP